MGTQLQPALGLPFGRYRLLGQLGAGGMAVVYRAVVDGPRGFRRDVVIKRMLSAYAEDPQFINMMATEARLSALLRHPNIVQVSDFGEVDGEYFIAMELVDGIDLNTVMKKARQQSRIPPAEAVAFIVHGVADALAYAHALVDDDGHPLQIVHRDVSPSNVMVTAQGVVKLLDFGIAHAASHVREERTHTGTIKGKLSYMSPEQALGEPIDARSDIFALGTLFYECLTATRLFKGDNDAETLQRICHQVVVPPSTLAPGIPYELDQLVLKMLARPLDARFQSCGQVVAALQPILSRLNADGGALGRFLKSLGVAPKASSSAAHTIVNALPYDPNAGLGAPGDDDKTSPSVEPGTPLPVTTPPSRKLPWLPLALMAPGGAAVGGWASTRAHRNDVLPVVAAPATPPNAPTTQPQPAQQLPAQQLPTPNELPPRTLEAPPTTPPPRAALRLQVLGTAGADVLIDNKLHGQIPFDGTLPRSAGAHQLLVRRAGYSPMARRIDGDSDVIVHVSLAPLPATAPKRKPPNAPSSPSSGKPARQFDPERIDDPFAH